MDSMRDAEICWAALKTFKVAYAGDEIVEHHSGDFLREEASSWSSRTLDQLSEAGRISPVTIPSDEWLKGEFERRGLTADDARAVSDAEPVVGAGAASGAVESLEGVPASASENFPRPLGANRYELSDGSTVNGKRAADAAERALAELVEA